MNNEAHQQALAYLRSQWSDRAPTHLQWLADFDEAPLEGEGPVSVFRFETDVTGGDRGRYVVVAGRTEPNYYPDWGLSAEDVYALHLGTRFMLVMAVSQIPAAQLPPDAGARLRSLLVQVAPQAEVKDVHVVAGFHVNEAKYIVARVAVADETVVAVGYDAPPGIYRDVHLAPHVILRRHLGHVIRVEATQEQRQQRMQSRRQSGRPV